MDESTKPQDVEPQADSKTTPIGGIKNPPDVLSLQDHLIIDAAKAVVRAWNYTNSGSIEVIDAMRALKATCKTAAEAAREPSGRAPVIALPDFSQIDARGAEA